MRLFRFMLLRPALCALSFALPAVAFSQTPPKSELLPFGSEAPDIAGVVFNGEKGTRLSQYRGKVVAVDFWATWCTPCLLSIPELDRVRNELREEGYGDRFEIVSVNVDEDIPKARKFLELHPVGYPVIGDPMGIAMKRYGPWKLPATFLLTPEGKVHMIWLGYADYFPRDIKKLALELLGPPPGYPATGESGEEKPDRVPTNREASRDPKSMAQ